MLNAPRCPCLPSPPYRDPRAARLGRPRGCPGLGGEAPTQILSVRLPEPQGSLERNPGLRHPPFTHPSLELRGKRVRQGQFGAPALSQNFPRNFSRRTHPRDRWPSNLPAPRSVPAGFKESGTCLPDPCPSRKSLVSRRTRSEMKSRFSLFSLDAVMRSHHFRSEVIYLARTLKVRRSSLS